MISKIAGFSLFFLWVAVSSGYPQEIVELKLDQLVEEAIHNNPDLKAARHETASVQARISQAKAWDPPQVGVEFFKTPVDKFPNPADGSMEMDYFVQQMIPFPGKRRAASRAAESSAAMTGGNYRTLEKKIIRDVKSAVYALYFVQWKIRINSENQDLMHEFTEIAKRQYEVGMGNQADILRSQTELSILINEGINLEQEIKSAEAVINTLLSRPTNGPLGNVPDIVADPPEATFDQLKALAREVRPELQSMREYIAMNQAEVSAAELDVYPDFMVRVMYKDMADTSKDYWSTMGTASIPLALWSRGSFKGKIQEKNQILRKSEEDFRAMENTVLFQIQDALVNVESNRNLAALYKNTLIPQTEQTLYSTRSAYQTGKTAFFSLIDVYRMLLDARLNYHRSAMKTMESIAELEQAVGLDLSEMKQRIQ
ncbi:MAG: TolC family protein [Proteobacteria bacterium]|nr:TolC family protein [Pseudomonadota bacterium]MBU4472436.1 TolC family protein [Pseudomonadota bacterium]MCG2751263.1 TolC family protein [Desulfobacteraceae bacterium]